MPSLGGLSTHVLERQQHFSGERRHWSGCACVPVRGHIGNNHLLRSCIPEIINAQAALGIARIATILDVPVRDVRLPLPPYPELVSPAG